MSAKGKKGRKPDKELEKKLKQVIDPVLARALAHPLRNHILMTLGDRIVSPSEVARELGIAARDLSYHFRVLIEIGVIKLVRTEKRRGVFEHFYTLDSRVAHLDGRDWEQIPELFRSSFSASLLQAVVDEAVEALRAGTFNARDNHHSRMSMVLDEQGCAEMHEVLKEALERMLEIRKACSPRLEKGPRRGVPMEVFMISFETASGTPSAKPEQPVSSRR